MTAIDNKLFDLQMAANRIIATDAQAYVSMWAVYAITRYIRTGRSSLEWESALLKADAQKLITFVAKRGATGGADTELLKRTNSYLRKHCGLKA